MGYIVKLADGTHESVKDATDIRNREGYLILIGSDKGLLAEYAAGTWHSVVKSDAVVRRVNDDWVVTVSEDDFTPTN